MPARSASLLATRSCKLLLCAVQFLDVADSSIMNVALPSIRRDLGFSALGLLNASQQLGTALGLAIFSAIATARTSTLLTAPGQVPAPELAG